MKKLFFMAAAMLSVPSAFAAESVVEPMLGGIIGASGDDIIVKLALWFLLFAVMYVGASKVFEDNLKAAAVVSVIVSFIAVRFMPASWFSAFKSYLFVAAVVLVPYFLVQMVFREPGWPRRIAYAVSLLLLWFLVAGIGGDLALMAFRGNEIVELVFYLLSAAWLFRIPFEWLLVIGLAIIFLVAWVIPKLFKKK